ncbi:MAG TPA: hypothetical protein VMY42_26225 [Thermoguttaceae bacterium]|nr:hypothetical protein [Thermoguttaceae bacterium]
MKTHVAIWRVMGIGLLAVAATSFSQNPASADNQKESATEFAKVTDEDIAKMPSFYYFDYPYDPLPGKRLWLRIDKQFWVERYPNGLESRFRIIGRSAVNGIDGTVVVKISGNPEKTGTDNQGGLQAFIPDRDSKEPEHRYRNLARGDKEWVSLGEMKCVH